MYSRYREYSSTCSISAAPVLHSKSNKKQWPRAAAAAVLLYVIFSQHAEILQYSRKTITGRFWATRSVGRYPLLSLGQLLLATGRPAGAKGYNPAADDGDDDDDSDGRRGGGGWPEPIAGTD